MSRFRVRWSVYVLALAAIAGFVAHGRRLPASPGNVTQITIPDEDRFVPYAITIHVGDGVRWVNTDSDDHTLVSNDRYNTAGHHGINVVLKANGGSFMLKFDHAGVFPFYCRFHSMLDKVQQPIAPGPEGGIQDANGNFGTPMNGVVTVVDD